MPDEMIGQGDVVKGYYSKAERKAQIMAYLADGKIRATSEVAKALRMQNSTNFRAILVELFQDRKVLAYSESRMYRWQRPSFKQLPLGMQFESEVG